MGKRDTALLSELIDRLDKWPTFMRLVHLYEKTEILKYQIAEYNDPLDYMRAAMAIRWGLSSSNYSNPITYFLISWMDNMEFYTFE